MTAECASCGHYSHQHNRACHTERKVDGFWMRCSCTRYVPPEPERTAAA